MPAAPAPPVIKAEEHSGAPDEEPAPLAGAAACLRPRVDDGSHIQATEPSPAATGIHPTGEGQDMRSDDGQRGRRRGCLRTTARRQPTPDCGGTSAATPPPLQKTGGDIPSPAAPPHPASLLPATPLAPILALEVLLRSATALVVPLLPPPAPRFLVEDWLDRWEGRLHELEARLDMRVLTEGCRFQRQLAAAVMCGKAGDCERMLRTIQLLPEGGGTGFRV